MTLPISRGEVRIPMAEILGDFVNSFLPKSLNVANEDVLQDLKKAIMDFTSASEVILFPYARSAFHAALKALDLPSNSKILLTPITIGPMIEVIEALGHEAVFVDIETDSFGASIADLKEKINSDNAAVFLYTHLFGYVDQIDEVAAICKAHNVFLIEDISHNLGSSINGKKVGLIGDVGIYSASLLKYVDSYNGAFLITNNAHFGSKLNAMVSSFKSPSKKRIRNIIFRSLIWKVALSRYFFAIVTFPSLFLLKMVSPSLFENLLGPGIKYSNLKELPDFYFERLSMLQAKAMIRGINSLSKLIESRRSSAYKAIEALNHYDQNQASLLRSAISTFTFWQFILPVTNVAKSKKLLFKMGVETSTTNLRDLAFDNGVILKGARVLKEKCIFIPLHSYMSLSDYQNIYRALYDAGLLRITSTGDT